MSGGRTNAVTAREFARAIDRLGPFERKPEIAVAVSGGADSLALALLLDRWARARDGRVLALTVDHGLREESAAEARQVGRWLTARGISHRTLRWRGRKPRRGIQAAARVARYGLLQAWCRRQGVLHLALAHHRDDQIETFLMRLGHGSGLDGLAGMPPVAERDGVRLLRPLLDLPKARLVASLRAAGQGWIEDPSNENPTFERVRLRRQRGGIEAAGVVADRLPAVAASLARARAINGVRIDALLVEAAMSPDRLVRLPGAWLAGVPRPIGLRALAQLLQAVNGGDYAPRVERLERCYDWLVGGSGRARTLGGCLIFRHRDRLYVMPEQAPGGGDRPRSVSGRSAPGWRPLGAAGWRKLLERNPRLAGNPPPPEFRERALAFWRGGEPVVVPALGLGTKLSTGPGTAFGPPNRRFHPLIPARFAVA